MENFVLYHEIYKRDGMTMYKGRKKGTITYVAISCIDKGERIKVTNHVRLVYELEQKHIVKFFEWYETSNHLWLVTELCVGGTLAQILQQDVRLSEDAVRIFGTHLMRGMHYMHCNELIYVDWHPAKIILAGDGSLKFFDFSNSRKVDEDPHDLVQRYFSTINPEQKDIDELLSGGPMCEYTAPEVILGSPPCLAGDLWGLGCLMYEMFAGSPPFTDKDSILNTPLIVPRAHSASVDLNDLLQSLLAKQPESRISLSEVCSHPFWKGALDDICGPCSPLSVNHSRPQTVSHIPTVVNDDDCSTSTVDDVSFTLHLGSRISDTRERVVEVKTTNVEETSVTDRHQLLMELATSSTCSKDGSAVLNEDYLKMVKDGRLKYDPKVLPVPPYSQVKWKTLRSTEKLKHLKQIDNLLKTVEKGPPSQRRLHLLNYLAQLSLVNEVSTHMMESGLALDICRQLKSTSNQELLARTCQTLAIIFHNSTSPSTSQDVSTVYGEVITILVDVLRDQFRCSRIKLPCVSALGETLLKLAQATTNSPLDLPTVSSAVTLLNRCLHRTEEVVVSLAAAKVIDASAHYDNSSIAKQLASAETMQQLYTGYRHATTDSLKTTAVSALCRLSRVDPSLFSGLLDKVSPQALLENLHLGLLAVQEAILEMFLLTLISNHRPPQEPSAVLSSAMRLLETTAPLVRAKTLLLVLLLCETDIALLRLATDLKLVLYLERELRRPSPLTNRCLSLFTSFLSNSAVPAILQQCCSALTAIQGRRHPSSLHIKNLRRALPLLDSLSAIAASSSLRAHLFLPSPAAFFDSLGALLLHCHHIDNGYTTLPPDSAPHFLTHVLSLVEAATHSRDVPLLVATLLAPLARLTAAAASNADLRVIGLKLCADIVQQVEPDSSPHQSLVDAVESCLLPQSRQFFLDPDPSSLYLLRLLRHYLSLNSSSFLQNCRVQGLVGLLLQLLLDHQSRVMTATVLECLLFLSSLSSLPQDGLLRDLLLEADFLPLLCELVLDIGDQYHREDRLAQQCSKAAEMFLTALETLHSLSRLIADVVRLALQSKKRADSDATVSKLTAEAEELLSAGRPLTVTVDLLVFTVGDGGDGGELRDSAVKLLNQVVSLYGGQQIEHGLRDANLRSLCVAIDNASVSQRRTLLRILRRLLAASTQGPLQEGITVVRDMVTKMGPLCVSEGDSQSRGLLDDISRCIEKL